MPRAFAQEEITVSVAGDVGAGGFIGHTRAGFTDSESQAANAFTTGTHAAGYTLSEVGFIIEPTLNAEPGTTPEKKGDPGPIQVAIHEHTSTLVPGNRVGSSAMLAQASVVVGANSVTLSPAVSLQPMTTYFVVFSTPNVPSSGTHTYSIRRQHHANNPGSH